MAPTEVQIPDFVPPKEMSIADLMAAAVARSTTSTIDFKALLANADVVEGRALVDKASMIGMPHIITSVAFHKGVKDKEGISHDFVSCEFTTLPSTGAPIEGVYNDGSTGIRRQIVGYLASKGILPEGYTAEPDTSVWVEHTEEETDPEFSIKFLAPRGLRVSEYKNAFVDEGKTYYLA